MRVLKTFTPFLRLISAFNRNNLRQSSWRSILRSIFHAFGATMIIIANCMWFTLIVWGLVENDADLQKFVVAIPLLTTFIQLQLTFVDSVMKNHIITETIKQLQRVIDQRCKQSKQAYGVYAAAERKHALFTTVLFALAVASSVSLFSLGAVSPISYAIFSHPAPEHWRVPLEMHSLMGQDNYIGFFLDWSLELSFALVTNTIVSLSGSIYIGIFLYINGMVKDMKTELMRTGRDSFTKRKEWTQKQMWSIYMREIRFHVEIIGVASSLRDMMEVILLNITLTCIIVIACNLFVIELSVALSFEVFIALIDMCFVVALTFAYFYFAEWITLDIYEVGDIFYDSTWYRLPIKHQKLLLLPIHRSGREVRLTGLGLFYCSLPVFSKLIRSAASYYLVIRSFK